MQQHTITFMQNALQHHSTDVRCQSDIGSTGDDRTKVPGFAAASCVRGVRVSIRQSTFHFRREGHCGGKNEFSFLTFFLLFFPFFLSRPVYRSSECDVVRGECTQTYVPYLFLVIPLGPVTLTGQDYVLVESGCVCKPKYAADSEAKTTP